MKKTMRTGKSPLVLRREHIRLLTPTDLAQAAGGKGTLTETTTDEKPTKSDACTVQSVREANSCNVIG